MDSNKNKKLKYIAIFYCVFMGIILFARFGTYTSGIPYLTQVKAHFKTALWDSIPGYFENLINPNESVTVRAIAFINLVGNFVFFVPIGIFLPMFFKAFKRIYVFLPGVVMMIFTIESLQAITLRGTFDSDDILLNTVAALCGFVGYKIYIFMADYKS